MVVAWNKFLSGSRNHLPRRTRHHVHAHLAKADEPHAPGQRHTRFQSIGHGGGLAGAKSSSRSSQVRYGIAARKYADYVVTDAPAPPAAPVPPQA